MTRFKRRLACQALLPVSFPGFAFAWALVAPRCLYYCWDDAPLFDISWHPPFIHSWADSWDGKLHDFYRVPEWLVYGIWIGFIAGIFLIPAAVISSFVRQGKVAQP